MANQLALITGASSGIGEAFARQLAARGVDLCITARRAENLEHIAAELRGQHQVDVEVIAVDLAAEDGVNQIVEWIKAHSVLTLLVNNAGFGVRGLFFNKPVEKYTGMIAVHVMATMKLTSAALPAMIKAQHGGVINVSSVTAYMPLGGNAVYAGTKAFLNAFSEALVIELKGTGVTVQTLIPGFTYSDFHKRPEYAAFDAYSSLPKFMWMTADEVVRASLRALDKNKARCIPGMLNKLFSLAGRSGLAALGSALMARRYKAPRQNTEKR